MGETSGPEKTEAQVLTIVITYQQGTTSALKKYRSHCYYSKKPLHHSFVYTKVLGCEEITFGSGRKGIQVGDQKINLHEQGNEYSPNAKKPTVGSADICFLTDTAIDQVAQKIKEQGYEIISEPLQRSGARGMLHSIYLYDPDGNLIEISNVASIGLDY